MAERVPEPTLNQTFAGRFYTSNAGGFSAKQYADMIMTALFESAKNAPQPLKTQILEFKLEAGNIVFHYVNEAMEDAKRLVGRQYELNEKKKGRLLLPGGLAQHLDQGGVWDEAKAMEPKKD